MPRPKHLNFLLVPALCALSLLSACNQNKPQPVSPEEFFARQSPTATPQIPPDQPGVMPIPSQQPPTAVVPKIEIPQAVQNVIQPNPEPTTRPEAIFALAPTTQPIFAPGQYLTLGCVVAEVNGTPIYANKILRLNAITLRNLAREYDITRFEIAARSLLEKTRDEQVDIELEYAAADQALDSSEKDIARGVTRQWREKQISEAGGSLEVLRRRFLYQGLVFEEAERDKYREFVVEIYYTKKLSPLAIVTADDMRQYYRLHIADVTVPDKAEIRILQKDSAKDGRDIALSHIQEYRKRAANGEDFATLVSDYSDLSVHKDQGGYFLIEGNSFAITKVADAIWTLQPGQISEVIEDNGKFYIIKVLSLQHGGTKPFEDEQIQRSIEVRLETQQFSKLRLANLERLDANAIVSENSQQMDVAIQMALQNYPRWAGK